MILQQNGDFRLAFDAAKALVHSPESLPAEVVDEGAQQERTVALLQQVEGAIFALEDPDLSFRWLNDRPAFERWGNTYIAYPQYGPLDGRSDPMRAFRLPEAQWQLLERQLLRGLVERDLVTFDPEDGLDRRYWIDRLLCSAVRAAWGISLMGQRKAEVLTMGGNAWFEELGFCTGVGAWIGSRDDRLCCASALLLLRCQADPKCKQHLLLCELEPRLADFERRLDKELAPATG